MIGRGFTLLEVMIAVGVLALIGTLTYKSFDGAYDLKQRVEKAEDRDQTVRAALDRIAREVSMTFLSEHYDHKRFRERPTIFKGENSGDRDTLMFTAFAHDRLYRDAKESDQALIEYKIDSDPDRPGKFLKLKVRRVANV